MLLDNEAVIIAIWHCTWLVVLEPVNPITVRISVLALIAKYLLKLLQVLSNYCYGTLYALSLQRVQYYIYKVGLISW